MRTAIFWNGRAVDFGPGDTVATALLRAGVWSFGLRPGGGQYAVFCGIGQCQGCLVADEAGQTLEACLKPCEAGRHYQSVVLQGPPDA